MELDKVEKSYMWPLIQRELAKIVGEVGAETAIKEADALYREYKSKIIGLKGVALLHKQYAYCAGAIYIALSSRIGKEEAKGLLDSVWKIGAKRKCDKLDKIPGWLFIPLCKKIAVSSFGEKAGFKQELISKDKYEVRFNVLHCPYVDALTEMGVKEVCPLICKQDEYSYGGMKRIDFIRSKTIGRGDALCDFCYRRKGK